MEQDIVQKFAEFGILGIGFLGLAYVMLKFYAEDRKQIQDDKIKDNDQMQESLNYYRQEIREQREMFTNAMDRFHTQMEKFGEALTINNTQIEMLNNNMGKMGDKVDTIQCELEQMKNSLDL